jgi:prevent-host-death family protein
LVISATEFKAKCLELMDLVNETGVTIQITKRGKVVAEMVGTQERRKRVLAGFGSLRTSGHIDGSLDIHRESVEPEFDEKALLKKWDERLK